MSDNDEYWEDDETNLLEEEEQCDYGGEECIDPPCKHYECCVGCEMIAPARSIPIGPCRIDPFEYPKNC